MASLDELTGSLIGGVKSAGGGFVNMLTIIAYILIFAAIVGGITYYFVIKKKYNKKIIIYEDIAGQGYIPTRTDIARVVKFGKLGEEILWLKKNKVYRTAHGKKIGLNTYAFAVAADGYWYNITFGDLNKELKELKIKPTPQEMRLTHIAIGRNINDSFDKKNWLKDNIAMIVSIGAIIIVLVFLWMIMDKWMTMNDNAIIAQEIAMDTTKEINQLLSKMDNICSGGSGLVQVPAT